MKPPYEITSRMLESYGRIRENLGRAKSFLLVKPEARLRRANRIKTIHSSLGIEGNTLSLEHVTALLDNKRVLGPAKDILEVRNAIAVYASIGDFKAFSGRDFLKAHRLLMQGLVKTAGQWRRTAVGIMKGREVTHIAPPSDMVPALMKDLFDYVKNDKDPLIIRSCVFHYENEFIHPFEDGNGRMGRLWQTRLLMLENPVFEFVPVEETIRNHQADYYKALSASDRAGNSTVCIEFMLDALDKSLSGVIDASTPSRIGYEQRSEKALSAFKSWFDRKAYRALNKGISSATASRDLARMTAEGRVETDGDGPLRKYRGK
jgi:Fic family protein